MKTIIIGDADGQKSMFMSTAGQLSYLQVLGFFQELNDACDFMLNNSVDLVILDINILGESGIAMGRQLRVFYPDVRLLYVTGVSTYPYVLEAVRINSGAYILTPYTSEDLDYAINASGLFLKKKKKKRVFARTFGYFDLFVDDVAVAFKSSKSRELLAILIDRHGGIVTSDQAIGTLWENRANDETTQSLYSKVGRGLQNQLDEVGAGHIVISSRGSRNIDVDALDCDLYQMLNGDEGAKRMYFGQYMMDYSWAEYRLAGLERFLGD